MFATTLVHQEKRTDCSRILDNWLSFHIVKDINMYSSFSCIYSNHIITVNRSTRFIYFTSPTKVTLYCTRSIQMLLLRTIAIVIYLYHILLFLCLLHVYGTLLIFYPRRGCTANAPRSIPYTEWLTCTDFNHGPNT